MLVYLALMQYDSFESAEVNYPGYERVPAHFVIDQRHSDDLFLVRNSRRVTFPCYPSDSPTIRIDEIEMRKSPKGEAIFHIPLEGPQAITLVPGETLAFKPFKIGLQWSTSSVSLDALRDIFYGTETGSDTPLEEHAGLFDNLRNIYNE